MVIRKSFCCDELQAFFLKQLKMNLMQNILEDIAAEEDWVLNVL